MSRAAKESRIYVHAIINNTTTMRIYTHKNGACIYPYQKNVTLLIFLSYWSLQDPHRVYKLRNLISSNLVLVARIARLTLLYGKISFFLCILVKGIPWIPLKIPLSIFQPRIHLKVLNYIASITQCCLLYLQCNFGLQ